MENLKEKLDAMQVEVERLVKIELDSTQSMSDQLSAMRARYAIQAEQRRLATGRTLAQQQAIDYVLTEGYGW